MDTRAFNRVLVSWEEEWRLPEYVKRYLKSRRADFDYFRDADLGR